MDKNFGDEGRKIMVEKVYSLKKNQVEEYISLFLENKKKIKSIEETRTEFPCFLVTFYPFETYTQFLRSLFCGRYLHEISGVSSTVRITIFTGFIESDECREMFVQCDIKKMTDDVLVSSLSSYFNEYTYRKSPEGFIVKYSESRVIKPFPFHEMNVFPVPTDNIPIKNSHEVDAVYFIHKLNISSNLSPFHMRFSSAHVIETTIMMKKAYSIKNNTNCRVYVRTYIFHYSDRSLKQSISNYYDVDKLEMYCYHHYCVINRMLGPDEHDHFVRKGCQVHNVLIVENNGEWNRLLKAVQLIKKFSSVPYLKPEYRTNNIPLVVHLFQECEDDKIQIINFGRGFIMRRIFRPPHKRYNNNNNYNKYGIQFRRYTFIRGRRVLYQIFPGDFAENKELTDEITDEIGVLLDKSHRFHNNRVVNHPKNGETEWVCKLEIGKIMFWSSSFSRHAKRTEISLKEMSDPKKYRMDLTQFYHCDLSLAIHEYIRCLAERNKLRKKRVKDFPVTCVDCSGGKKFTLNFTYDGSDDDDDIVLQFDRYIERTLFARVLVAHSYSSELDFEISFQKHTEKFEVEGGVEWIVGLFHNKKLKDIEETILLTNDRYSFYYETNVENTIVQKFTHEKSGYDIEIKEERLLKKTNVLSAAASQQQQESGDEEDSRFITEYTTTIVPPKFVVQDGREVTRIIKNVSSFASQLLKKGKYLEVRRKSRKEKGRNHGSQFYT